MGVTYSCSHGCRRERGWGPGTVSVNELQRELATGYSTLLPRPDRYGHVVIAQIMNKLDLAVKGAPCAAAQAQAYQAQRRRDTT